ncbi:NAD(P)/FAD-dependent oxidoreductase [Bradyrhizobium sp. PMVTL-01]|uniref:NAD(P)/FAD-dependent oxidoreductase n=1 Tax=Bradyrhizobium sp. PMVTL-01 TaxID=3434999 RepID=UPI003F6FA23B
MARRIVIVGAGHAGTSAARALREHGSSDEIVLLTEERSAPYERPPLSKSVLTQEECFSGVAALAPGWLDQNGILFRSGVRVQAIDRNAQRVTLAGGDHFRYDYLLLATGAKARLPQLPGVGSKGVIALRSLDQSAVLRERLVPARRLVVIGGGLIGLEVAASARARGVDTTVLEKAPALLSRVVPTSTSERILELHRLKGTKVFLGADVEAIIGCDMVEGVRLRSGQEFGADTVLVAVGADPDVELAQKAGLATDDGILVNEYLQTADSRIFAAGDAARYPASTGKDTIRLEAWKNALDQGATAALNILGRKVSYRAVPWMWSDQFDKVFQVAGVPNKSQVEVNRSLDDGGIVTFLLDRFGVLEATVAFGSLSQVAKIVRVATSIIERRLRPSPSVLQDPSYDLRRLLRSDAANAHSTHEAALSAVRR